MNPNEEEPWEWDSCCTRCYTLMGWDGDAPEVPEDAICIDCMWKEIDQHRKNERENKMNVSEFTKRSAMFEARAKALDAAEHQERHIRSLVSLAQILLATLVVVLSWQVLTAKLLVIEVVALFIVRGISAVLVHHFWVRPTLKVINERYPAPEPKP